MARRGGKYISILAWGIIMFFLFAFFCVQNTYLTENITTLEGGWKFSLNGEEFATQPKENLESFIFPDVAKGDTITLTRKFQEANTDGMMLAFDTWHTVTNVYVDNAQIYSWGESYAQKGQMLGTARHCIFIQKDSQGKELKIELLATETNPMPNITSVVWYETSDGGAFWFNRPIILLFIGIFFVLFGVGISFVACIFISRKYHFLEPLMIGCTICSTGIYILCRGNFLQLVIYSPQIYNAIEYISLFITPLFILLHLYHDVTYCKNSFTKKLYNTTIWIYVLFMVGSLLLNFTTDAHFCEMLQFYYILALFTVLTIFRVVYICAKEQTAKKRKIYTLGILAFLFGAIISIVAFRLCYHPYWGEKLYLWEWYNYILPFSLCILVAFFVLAFFVDMKQIIDNSYRTEILNYMAYYDALTDIYNRRCFEEDMKKLDSLKGNTYGIISMDLNGLKQINDTFGHNIGDSMLKVFAEVLCKICGKDARPYRLGGDEFAIIVAEKNKISCEQIISNLQTEMERINRLGNPFTLSAAYGMAENQESAEALEIFDLADKRMYERKQQTKSAESTHKSH